MKHWEEYYYEIENKYNEEELMQIKILLRKNRTITAVFVPIVTLFSMAVIAVSILALALDNAILDTIAFSLIAPLAISAGLWAFFQYRNSKQRIKLMSSFEKKNKKPC